MQRDEAGIWECSRCGCRDAAPPYADYRGESAPQCRICGYPEDVNLVRADRAAYEFGAEACANNLGFGVYREDMAMYYGFRYWSNMPSETRSRASKRFWSGYEAESKHNTERGV